MELCPRCGAPLLPGSQRCSQCHAPGILMEQSALESPGQLDGDGADLEVVASGTLAPGKVSAVLEHWLTRPGARRQARMTLRVALVAALLLVSVAAWQSFVHSIWGTRLRALNQIVFVGSQSNPGASGPSEQCLTVTGPSGTISNCSYANSSKFPADPSIAFTPGQLYVLRPDGSGVRQITTAPGVSYLSPVWSPDGSQIATFVISGAAGITARLEVMDADGSNVRMMPSVSVAADAFSPANGRGTTSATRLIAWSPDGTQLLISLGESQFALIHVDGTNLHPFFGSDPIWSPDGRYLAYYIYAETTVTPAPGYPPSSFPPVQIEVLDTQTFQIRQITNVPTPGGQALAWSPDGRSLAYDASEGGGIQPVYADALMLVRPDGSNPRLVAQWTSGLIRQIAWSPDGRQIAAVVEPISYPVPGAWKAGTPELWVANSDGSTLYDIAASDSEQPSWAPDGKHLVFANPNDTALLLADTAARPKVTASPITAGAPFLFAPCWSPLAGL